MKKVCVFNQQVSKKFAEKKPPNKQTKTIKTDVEFLSPLSAESSFGIDHHNICVKLFERSFSVCIFSSSCTKPLF